VVFRTANKLVGQLEELGVLREITGSQRNRRYTFSLYMALFHEREEAPVATGAVQATAAAP
jgi:hypothetical protein